MSNIIDNYLEARRRRAARRELGNLDDHYLRDLGIERDRIEKAVEGLANAQAVQASHRAPRRTDWRRLFAVRRGTDYQTDPHGV